MYGPTKTARTPSFRSMSTQVPDQFCSKCQKEVNPFWSKEWQAYYAKIGAPTPPWFMKWVRFNACTCQITRTRLAMIYIVDKPIVLYMRLRAWIERE